MVAALRRFAGLAALVSALAAPLAHAAAAPASTIALSASRYDVAENAGSLTISVIRTGANSVEASVHYATADISAVAGTHYSAVEGTLHWARGETGARSFSVPIIDDSLLLPGRAFGIALSQTAGGALAQPRSARVQIHNDDSVVRFERRVSPVDEAAGSVTLTLERQGQNGQPATVSFGTADRGARAGADYSATNGTLQWAADETGTRSITIPVINDVLIERDEAFTVNLSGLQGVRLGTFGQAFVVIVSDDLPLATVADIDVTENSNADTPAVFTVSLSAATPAAVAIDYMTADGTATGGDYRARSGTLVFNPGETAKTITVPVVGDTVNEGSERFRLQLTRAHYAAIGRFEAVATIHDDDHRSPQDQALAPAALDALARGCDLLDAAHCLFPFPSNHFTVDAPPGSIQSELRGGTGKRVDFQIAAMPRNLAGKPADPTEWNRSDGFSPGALITTYVPGLSLEKTYGLPHAQIGIVNPALSQTSAANPRPHILVLEVPRAPETGAPREHLVIAEADANANLLVQYEGNLVPQPQPGKPALMIRPLKNFTEGRRYVVVLRDLQAASGSRLVANPAFAVCRDRAGSQLPAEADRCAALERTVFPVLDAAGVDRDDSLYLAWDFTVASTQNEIGRLRHMRDDAFATLSPDPRATDCTQYQAGSSCRAPAFTIDRVVTDGLKTGIAKRIEGTITVPSYVVPADPSPAEDSSISAVIDKIHSVFGAQADDVIGALGIAQGVSAPPNRLYYNPADGGAPTDPQSALYGDGLPDRLPGATMNTRFMCQIPAQASPDAPARPGIYGHGLLDSREAITYDGVPELSREFNYMFCAVDFFGFASGDLPNVATTLVDISNFPVVPDASQQGMLNFMFLARLLRDDHGFAARAEFQQGGRPVFDRSEVFYDGNSQGGILGGVILAASKDVNRGALGSLGMNYSTLLQRSKDFDLYAVPLYLSYPDPLDRDVAFSLIQMLWDRSENNGYAAHLTDNSAFGGPSKAVVLNPNFGDQQVSKWTADVMARTMGIPVDRQQTQRIAALKGQAQRDPDVIQQYGMTALDYADPAQAGGGAEIVWDDERTEIPPTDNVPPRAGRDPHDDSAKKYSGRCQKANFLRTGGQLVDVTPVEFDGAACPFVPLPAPTTAAGSGSP